MSSVDTLLVVECARYVVADADEHADPVCMLDVTLHVLPFHIAGAWLGAEKVSKPRGIKYEVDRLRLMDDKLAITASTCMEIVGANTLDSRLACG